ncbi:hypothetical protein [Pontibacter akesuensis]|uniref:Lipoprotein n=1 Tax=Pontibacter akesuensis TaxID=388950 RepID=A0A1I7JJN2_9BACT|nr:hypothetical protein [Pontibacter akesuensis]GHA69479.1 hypothetical protein GCM10007389_23230 [Pontibacter akesuensis]SFU85415.1 hypothetical protein SAMN04487941_2952 [Pontibacter akesuensis]
MKSLLYVTLLYLCLALLAAGCSNSAPVPACTAVEVVGVNCDTGWYILKLQDDSEELASKSGSYVGQLHGGYVTTDNLPEAYRQVGQRAQLRLELNTSYGPRCVATAMMYPAVRVTEVCGADNK